MTFAAPRSAIERCVTGDHPVVSADEEPAGLGSPRRFLHGSAQRVQTPRHLRVRHGCGLVGPARLRRTTRGIGATYKIQAKNPASPRSSRSPVAGTHWSSTAAGRRWPTRHSASSSGLSEDLADPPSPRNSNWSAWRSRHDVRDRLPETVAEVVEAAPANAILHLGCCGRFGCETTDLPGLLAPVRCVETPSRTLGTRLMPLRA